MSPEASSFANALRERLNGDLPSLRVWQDRPEIEGGVGWWRQIETALDQVEFLVSVMTPASEITARELMDRSPPCPPGPIQSVTKTGWERS